MNIQSQISLLEPAPQAGKELLRFLTCGSVDTGKSTLIGRLLYDSKLVFDDQLSALTRDSLKYGTTGDDADLALLVDGLEAEREQGITIDVAYRFFSTKRRSFIVADTPGHEQYTRNMVTGASTASLAIILVDARKGILTQTRRHSYICSLLGITSVILAVNKMDLVDFSSDLFQQIVAHYLAFAKTLCFSSIVPIPLSARYGDNVTVGSGRVPWFDGPTLLHCLENADADAQPAEGPFRLPVQLVCRPNMGFRGYAGTIAAGSIAVGDKVVVALAGRETSVTRIVTFDGDRSRATAGDAVTLVLADELDVARGDMLVEPQRRPDVSEQFAGHIVWMDDHPLLPGRSYLLRAGTKTVPARVTLLKHKVDINSLEHTAGRTLGLNEIGFCNISTSSPIAFDSYGDNRRTGSFILIDRSTNATVGAGMISFGLRRATNIHRQDHLIEKSQHAALKQQKPMILWFTGLSGSGKSTIANRVEKLLHQSGHHTFMLDGDNIRHGLNRDLGFVEADRVENIRRVGEVAKLFVEAGIVVLCCFISPFRAERELVRELVGPGEFAEIFVDVPLEECMRRDPKGLYAAVKAGKIKNFTGIDSPYEIPGTPDLHLKQTETLDQAAQRVLDWALPKITA